MVWEGWIQHQYILKLEVTRFHLIPNTDQPVHKYSTFSTHEVCSIWSEINSGHTKGGFCQPRVLHIGAYCEKYRYETFLIKIYFVPQSMLFQIAYPWYSLNCSIWSQKIQNHGALILKIIKKSKILAWNGKSDFGPPWVKT